MELHTPITSTLSNLTAQIFFPELVNPISVPASIGPLWFTFGKTARWPDDPNTTSKGDIIGWSFFGVITAWIWGPALAIFLYNLVVLPLKLCGCIVNKTTGRNHQQRRRTRHNRRATAQRTRQEWVAMMNRRANVRKTWAIEDLQLARKERVERLHIVSYAADMERGDPNLDNAQRNREFAFMQLPAELRMQVYSDLDYGTALLLGRTCKYFYEDKPEEGVDREQRATYVYHAETFACNKKADRLACFSCLKIIPRVDFREDMRTKEFDRFGTKELDRVCTDCEIKKGLLKWLRLRKAMQVAKRAMRSSRITWKDARDRLKWSQRS